MVVAERWMRLMPSVCGAAARRADRAHGRTTEERESPGCGSIAPATPQLPGCKERCWGVRSQGRLPAPRKRLAPRWCDGRPGPCGCGRPAARGDAPNLVSRLPGSGDARCRAGETPGRETGQRRRRAPAGSAARPRGSPGLGDSAAPGCPAPGVPGLGARQRLQVRPRGSPHRDHQKAVFFFFVF